MLSCFDFPRSNYCDWELGCRKRWNGWAGLAEREWLKVIRMKSPVEKDGVRPGDGHAVVQG